MVYIFLVNEFLFCIIMFDIIRVQLTLDVKNFDHGVEIFNALSEIYRSHGGVTRVD